MKLYSPVFGNCSQTYTPSIAAKLRTFFPVITKITWDSNSQTFKCSHSKHTMALTCIFSFSVIGPFKKKKKEIKQAICVSWFNRVP